jgi:hypothetical protein
VHPVRKLRRLRRQHDIRQLGQLGVNVHRSVDRGDDGNLDVEQAQQQLAPFAHQPGPVRRGDLRRILVRVQIDAEHLARASQDQRSQVRIA